MSNFTSGWVQYRVRRETGDSRAVTSTQERQSRNFSALPSPVFRLARFCTQPEVKFDTFICVKHREVKVIRNSLFRFSYENCIKITSSK